MAEEAEIERARVGERKKAYETEMTKRREPRTNEDKKTGRRRDRNKNKNETLALVPATVRLPPDKRRSSRTAHLQYNLGRTDRPLMSTSTYKISIITSASAASSQSATKM